MESDLFYSDLNLDNLEFFASSEAKPLVISPLRTVIKVRFWHFKICLDPPWIPWNLSFRYILFHEKKNQILLYKQEVHFTKYDLGFNAWFFMFVSKNTPNNVVMPQSLIVLSTIT